MPTLSPDVTPSPARPLPAGLPRAIEVPLAAVALILSAPLLAAAAAAVALTSPGGVFFRQVRVGRGGRAITLLKLRTMRDREGPKVTARGDPRVTAVGRLLRRTKLDELPELWNVLKGDLSWVGPRPEVPEFVDLSDPLWRQILEARPGLTDPVTVRLRNEEGLLASRTGDREEYYRRVLLPQKLRGSLAYLERRTAGSDLGVLVDTARAILFPRGRFPPEVDAPGPE